MSAGPVEVEERLEVPWVGPWGQAEFEAIWAEAHEIAAAQRAAERAAARAAAAAAPRPLHGPRDAHSGGVDWAHAVQSIERSSQTVMWTDLFGGGYLVVDGPAFKRLCEEYHECHGPGATKRDALRDMGRFFVLRAGVHWTKTGAMLSPCRRRLAGPGHRGATTRHTPRKSQDVPATRVRGLRA